MNLIGTSVFRNKPQKVLYVYVYHSLSSFWGWDLGTRLGPPWNAKLDKIRVVPRPENTTLACGLSAIEENSALVCP